MKKKYITLGNWNKNYIYIIATVICMNIFCLISGFGYHTYQIGIFIDYEHVGHIYIHKLFYYFIILICSFFYYLYERKRDNTNENILLQENNNNNRSANISQELIYHDIDYYGNKNISDSFALLIIFLFALLEHVDRIVHQLFSYGDYWMLELIIMAFLSQKMLQIKIYNHQKLSLYLVSIPIILKSVTIVLIFCDENNYFKNGEVNYKYNEETTLIKSLFVARAWLFPIAMISYFILMVLNSYMTITIKKIIDLKYMQISKLLILYGFFGTIISSLLSLIFTFISFGKKNNDKYDIYDYFCTVVDNNGDRYIENYKIYFTGSILKDLLYTLLGAVAYDIYILFVFQIVKYLDPIYKSFSAPLTFFTQKLILMYQINDNEPLKYINESYFIDLASDTAAIIGFLIYLEIIELNFFGLNKYLRKNIILRGNNDIKDNDIIRESNISEMEIVKNEVDDDDL